MDRFPERSSTGQPALEAALGNLAEEILQSIVDGAFCLVQPWDNRIDCCIKLDDGQIVGERVPLATLNTAVLRSVGERLKLRKSDNNVELQNEKEPPIAIVRS